MVKEFVQKKTAHPEMPTIPKWGMSWIVKVKRLVGVQETSDHLSRKDKLSNATINEATRKPRLTTLKNAYPAKAQIIKWG
jgi:hypothetical protein